jgi:hypothetical protein
MQGKSAPEDEEPRRPERTEFDSVAARILHSLARVEGEGAGANARRIARVLRDLADVLEGLE